MRLRILDRGHGLGTKLLFAIIRAATRQPVLDILKLTRYRRDFWRAQPITQEAMRGPSAWSVGDRELMAALVARTNQCQWCTTAHSEVAAGAYGDRGKVEAVLADLDGAPLEEPLRATLKMLRTLARERTIGAEDMRAVLAAGASRAQIEDALAVGFTFSMTARLADAFGFTMATPAAFASGARYLLARGYR